MSHNQPTNSRPNPLFQQDPTVCYSSLMIAAPIDFRTIFGPNGPPPPGLNCDGRNRDGGKCCNPLPYGETVCWSDPTLNLDYCEECIRNGQDDEPGANLIKTTVMERCAPIAETVYAQVLLSRMADAAAASTTPTASYEIMDANGEMCAHFVPVAPPSGEILSTILNSTEGAVRIERIERIEPEDPKDS